MSRHVGNRSPLVVHGSGPCPFRFHQVHACDDAQPIVGQRHRAGVDTLWFRLVIAVVFQLPEVAGRHIDPSMQQPAIDGVGTVGEFTLYPLHVAQPRAVSKGIDHPCWNQFGQSGLRIRFGRKLRHDHAILRIYVRPLFSSNRRLRKESVSSLGGHERSAALVWQCAAR